MTARSNSTSAGSLKTMIGSDLVPHGVMFHHFWNSEHPRGQGAITSEEFEKILHHVGLDRILPAQEWFDRALNGTLQPKDVCLTFDDALKCQIDVALPVLEKHGLTAFWFVYTSVIEGNLEMLELFRYFRTVNYPNIDAFYKEFHSVAEDLFPGNAQRGAANMPSDYLADFPFYTPSDVRFRYNRDHVLGQKNYDAVMLAMIERAGFDLKTAARTLWMTAEDIQQLSSRNHFVGLHTHTHPTTTGLLSWQDQKTEYQTNFDRLKEITGQPPQTMSHPCNSYNDDTLAILSELKISLGFRANMAQTTYSQLEHPRQDHANLMKELIANPV